MGASKGKTETVGTIALPYGGTSMDSEQCYLKLNQPHCAYTNRLLTRPVHSADRMTLISTI